MQVGPLAQVLVGYALGHKPTVYWANKTLETAGSIAKTTLTPAVLHSTLGRHAARMIRTQVIADLAREALEPAREQHRARATPTIFNEPVFPKGEQRGFGFHEAPRGTLSHWIVIRDGKIANYQAVVPVDLERRPARREGSAGPVRGVAGRQPRRRRGAAARADPHRPLVRSLPRVRHPHRGRRGHRNREGEGAVKVRVLGLGNVLMSDDGFGPFVVRVLEATYECPPDVEFVDVGTPGLDLTPYLLGHRGGDLRRHGDVDGRSPGRSAIYDRDDILRHPPQTRTGGHDPALKEALLTVEAAGGGPRTVTLVGVIPEWIATGVVLSPALEAAISRAVMAVIEELEKLGVNVERRRHPLPVDVWWTRSESAAREC